SSRHAIQAPKNELPCLSMSLADRCPQCIVCPRARFPAKYAAPLFLQGIYMHKKTAPSSFWPSYKQDAIDPFLFPPAPHNIVILTCAVPLTLVEGHKKREPH